MVVVVVVYSKYVWRASSEAHTCLDAEMGWGGGTVVDTGRDGGRDGLIDFIFAVGI